MTQSNATPEQAQTPPAPQTNPLNYAPPMYSGPPATRDDANQSLLMFIMAIIPLSMGPLIIWLLRKDSQPYVEHQGKEIINWQITVAIATVICAPLTILFGLGLLLGGIVHLTSIVLNILGAIKADKGEPYRYPFALRFLK